jgi:hypothetical protein
LIQLSQTLPGIGGIFGKLKLTMLKEGFKVGNCFLLMTGCLVGQASSA